MPLKCPSVQKHARGNRCDPPAREREQKQYQGTAYIWLWGFARHRGTRQQLELLISGESGDPEFCPPGFVFITALSEVGLSAGLRLIFTSKSPLIEVRGESLRNINTDGLGNCSR